MAGAMDRPLGDPARDAPDHAPAGFADRSPHPVRRRVSPTASTQEIELARRKARAESIGAALAGVVAVAIWVVAVFSDRQRARHQSGTTAGRRRRRRRRPRLRRPEPRPRLHQRLVHADRGPVRHRRPGRPRRRQRHGRAGLVAHHRLRGADGTVWHVPNGEVRRVGNQSKLWSMAVVDVDVAVDADLDAAREHVLQAADELCADNPSGRAMVLERAACARHRVGQRRGRHDASRGQVEPRPAMGAATRAPRGDQARARHARASPTRCRPTLTSVPAAFDRARAPHRASLSGRWTTHDESASSSTRSVSTPTTRSGRARTTSPLPSSCSSPRSARSRRPGSTCSPRCTPPSSTTCPCRGTASRATRSRWCRRRSPPPAGASRRR